MEGWHPIPEATVGMPPPLAENYAQLIGEPVLEITPEDRNHVIQKAQDSLWLPPRDAWLIKDPHKEKIETRLDSLGRVDIHGVITDIKALVDPSYQWLRLSINPDHFQWPEEDYSREPIRGCDVSPAYFRNLPPCKGHLPRVLENWKHLITIKPPVPQDEVMYFSIEAWRVAEGLFSWARDGTVAERLAKNWLQCVMNGTIFPKNGDETKVAQWLQEEQARLAKRREQYLERLEGIPPEFHLVNGSMSPEKVAGKVGRLVLKSSHQLRRAALAA